MTPTQEEPVNTICVRVRGSAPTYRVQGFAWKHAIWCDAAIMPNRPIQLGQRVRLTEVTGLSECPGEEEEEEEQHKDLDLEVEGTITDIRTVEEETIKFVVRNEVDESMTELAYLSIENIQGKTVILQGWRWLVHCVANVFLQRTTWRTPILELLDEEEATE